MNSALSHNQATSAFTQVSFSRQFLLTAVTLLSLGMLATGIWLGREIERSVLERSAALIAAYTRGVLEPILQTGTNTILEGKLDQLALDRAFRFGPLNEQIVHVKIWDRQGRIVYTSNEHQRGLVLPLDDVLQQAFSGEMVTHITPLDEKRHALELSLEPNLQEVYVPLLSESDASPILVAELYHTTQHIRAHVQSATRRSWVMVGFITALIYGVLYLLARRANQTIISQRQASLDQLNDLQLALTDNERMRKQVSHAGAVTTTLNEQALRRWAADLHDGPAQSLALALMQLDTPDHAKNSLSTVVNTLRTALLELRHIAAGMGVPGLEQHAVGQTVERAVREFQRQTGMTVHVEMINSTVDAPLPIKLALYRVLQSSLSNICLHAAHSRIKVSVLCDSGIHMQICDDGPGFDTSQTPSNEHWGLSFMRERVHLLGGSFHLHTALGQGVCITVDLPLHSTDLQ